MALRVSLRMPRFAGNAGYLLETQTFPLKLQGQEVFFLNIQQFRWSQYLFSLLKGLLGNPPQQKSSVSKNSALTSEYLNFNRFRCRHVFINGLDVHPRVSEKGRKEASTFTQPLIAGKFRGCIQVFTDAT